jgi:RNA polymerase sigma-70 factor (ECF subfamily)
MTESSAPLRLVTEGYIPAEAARHETADDGDVPAGFDANELITALYAENAVLVMNYANKLLNDRHLAEDVLQETMLRAWRYCAQFSEQKGSVRGWLVKVAHNIAMDKIRRRRSRPEEVAEDMAPEVVVEDHADAVANTLQVHHALSMLSPGHRAVLEHIYLHGRTAAEAAARLGIPEGTAYSRSHYALRVLRHELGVELGLEPGVEQQPPAAQRPGPEHRAA